MHPIQEKILKLSESHDITKIGYRRAGQLIGVNHPQQVKHHVSQLIKKGYLNTNKSTNIVSHLQYANLGEPKFTKIPVYGSANCGIASFIAQDRIEGYIKVSNTLLKNKNVFATRAVGNSLNKARINNLSIEDGDYVLVDYTKKIPRNGEYVLSVIEQEANIKKFVSQGNHIALLSESTEKHDPIYISESDSYVFVGVVTQVIKSSINQ